MESTNQGNSQDQSPAQDAQAQPIEQPTQPEVTPETAAPVEQPAAAPSGESLEKEIEAALGGQSLDEIMQEDAAKTKELAAEAAGDSEGKDPGEFHSQIRRGRIAAIRGDDVFIDLAGDELKLQGVVPAAQFDRPPRIGAIMDFVVDHIDEAQGLVFLSREGAISQANWLQLKPGMSIEARCTATNKGGLELELVGSIKGFMPASQIDVHHVEDLEQFVGQKMTGVVQEIDHKAKRVVLSRRQQLDKERKAAKDELLDEIAEGQIRKGTVRSIVDFGAFVDLGGVDGLVHVTDMSYTHISKPADFVKVGEEVEVKVLKLDKEKDRISLGMKQVKPDPWSLVEGKYKVGDQVEGTVLRTANFGAFIELEAGIEGLLPMSEMSWGRVRKAEDVVKVGDKVRLGIISLDAEKHKMSLSIKASLGDPWVGAEHKFAKFSVVKGKVLSTTNFGAFVELESGIEGLVHISELSDKRVRTVESVVKAGDERDFRVIEISEADHKIKLSIKAIGKSEEEISAGQQPRDQKPSQMSSSKRERPKNLKSGLGEVGGMGLGGLKLEDFLK
ncbi:S1 RNA-binding domain-containing protein [Planctomycetota bacterium]|nr:S1 RNA-binding domain-containing protein [Planctomycetota bacterium]